MREIIVAKNQEGQRLNRVLEKYLNKAPRSFIYKMLRKKNILLNEKRALGNEILDSGDVIKIYLAEETIHKFMDAKFSITNFKLDVIYEDNHVILINKPVGVLSQKAKEDDQSMVEHIISYLLSKNEITEESLQNFRPSICNRLDRNTSGIITAGKTLKGLQELNKLFKKRTVKKDYLCVVNGQVLDEKDDTAYIAKDKESNKVHVVSTLSNHQAKGNKDDDKEYQEIKTKYKPIKTNGNITLLKVGLITGKTHQIRAYLATTGHPILGDYKYGDTKINEYYKKKYGLESQLLHGYKLTFPEMKGDLELLSNRQFLAEVPDLFREICKEENL